VRAVGDTAAGLTGEFGRDAGCRVAARDTAGAGPRTQGEVSRVDHDIAPADESTRPYQQLHAAIAPHELFTDRPSSSCTRTNWWTRQTLRPQDVRAFDEGDGYLTSWRGPRRTGQDDRQPITRLGRTPGRSRNSEGRPPTGTVDRVRPASRSVKSALWTVKSAMWTVKSSLWIRHIGTMDLSYQHREPVTPAQWAIGSCGLRLPALAADRPSSRPG
jgi:hypothetical protein